MEKEIKNCKFYLFVCGEKDPDILSRIIQWRLGTDYSHMGIIVECDGAKIIYHCVGKGFCTEHYSEFIKEHNIWEVDITRFMMEPNYALGYLQGREGINYSRLQYLGFVFPWLRFLVHNGKARGICSEEAARFMYQCCDHHLKIDSKKFDFFDPKVVWDKVNEMVARRTWHG